MTVMTGSQDSYVHIKHFATHKPMETQPYIYVKQHGDKSRLKWSTHGIHTKINRSILVVVALHSAAIVFFVLRHDEILGIVCRCST